MIGCSAAYYITRHPAYDASRHAVTVLEASRLAGGASGKAGGLLAQWAYPSSLVPLSFELHAQLAAEHDGASAWGYRAIRCGKLTARDRRLCSSDPDAPSLKREQQQPQSTADTWVGRLTGWLPLGKRRELYKDPANATVPVAEVPEDLDWFRRESIVAYEDIAPRSETAQVHPYQFTLKLAQLAEEAGARILTGCHVEEIQYALGEEDEDEEPQDRPPASVNGVRYSDRATASSTTIPADVVVLAAGPWTPDLFPAVPMRPLRAHSVTIKPTRRLSAYCLFTEIALPRGSSPPPHSESEREHFSGAPSVTAFGQPQHHGHHGAEHWARGVRLVSPEIYSRPNNEVYVAGEADSRVPLPASTDEVEVDRDACHLIEEAVSGASDELRDGLVTGRRACYLPFVDVPSGNPLIGSTWIDGLVLATGHGCWGIQNAPATGKLISEIVFDGEARSADISSLDPRIVI